MTPAAILLALVTAERLAELWHARRNTRALLARGASELAPSHFPFIVGLHALWLGGLWLVGAGQPVDPGWLAVFAALQAARVWVLATLGRRWTTRIIVVPGEARVAHGPYRLMAHPNYAVVAGEIAVLPLCLGLPWYALVFSLANAAILAVRIRAEAAGLRRYQPDAAG